MTAARRIWRARYRQIRRSGIPSAFRHPPLIRAEAERLRGAGSLADVDGAERAALESADYWHGRNARAAIGREPVGVGYVVDVLTMAAHARNVGAYATARHCIQAARLYRCAHG